MSSKFQLNLVFEYFENLQIEKWLIFNPTPAVVLHEVEHTKYLIVEFSDLENI